MAESSDSVSKIGSDRLTKQRSTAGGKRSWASFQKTTGLPIKQLRAPAIIGRVVSNFAPLKDTPDSELELPDQLYNRRKKYINLRGSDRENSSDQYLCRVSDKELSRLNFKALNYSVLDFHGNKRLTDKTLLQAKFLDGAKGNLRLRRRSIILTETNISAETINQLIQQYPHYKFIHESQVNLEKDIPPIADGPKYTLESSSKTTGKKNNNNRVRAQTLCSTKIPKIRATNKSSS